MTTVSQSSGATHELAEEDRLRAQFYDFIAQYLSEPPTAERLVAAGRLSGGETALGQAIERFALVAGRCDPATADDEYSDLFIGVGRGELLPFGSYYLTGFLHEKPLARLKEDMAPYGIVRREDVTEPEDHVASVLETMAGLIDGRFGAARSLAEQKQFFDAHIITWMPVFFRDLAEASSSVLYASLADVGLRFLEIEAQGFAFGTREEVD
jgi:TorA maturation chaperone TorD